MPSKIILLNYYVNYVTEYEEIFKEFSIGDRMPKHQLKPFFNEAGHKPAERDINFAYNAVFKSKRPLSQNLVFVNIS